MEEDIYKSPEHHLQQSEKRIQTRLEKVIDIAEKRNKYESAHNPDLLKALDIVKRFLQRKRRVTYGGTAMNAILPEENRFYNPEVDLPDYDFFTPSMESDIEELVRDLKRAGMKDVYHKIGMHDGTMKVLVDFVPIADITRISKEIYDVFHKRAIKRDGVYYTDPDVLRMMMYLEISRPKGQVDRWEKVFERLELINKVFPVRRKSKLKTAKKSLARKVVQEEIWSGIYNFCIENKRTVISGGDLDSYYRSVVTKGTAKFDLERHSSVIGFICPDIKSDAKILQELLGGHTKCKLYLHEKRGEIVPVHIEVRYHSVPVALLYQETACHAYLSFPLKDGRSISLGSMDTLITIYYAISIFTKRARELIPGIDSKIASLIQLNQMNRRMKDPNIPSFPINCDGYQKGYPTLLREKVARIRMERERH